MDCAKSNWLNLAPDGYSNGDPSDEEDDWYLMRTLSTLDTGFPVFAVGNYGIVPTEGFQLNTHIHPLSTLTHQLKSPETPIPQPIHTQ